MTPRLRLAIIGDPHLAVPRGGVRPADDPYLNLDLGRKRHHDSARLLELTIAAVNAEPDVDAVLLLGDMTRDSELFNHEAAAELLRQLAPPMYVMAGNHDFVREREPGVTYPDCECLDRGGFIEFWRGRGLPEPALHYAVELPGGVDLLVLDSNRTLAELAEDGATVEVQDHGRVSLSQLSWLERRLEQTVRAGRLPLLAVHHTLLDQSPAERPSDELYAAFRHWKAQNAGDVVELAHRHRVPLALSGHLHAQSAAVESGLTNLVTAAAVTYPHAWRMLTVEVDAIHVEARSLERELGREFMERSRSELAVGWSELIESHVRRYRPELTRYAAAIHSLVEASGWWPRFCDGTLAGFRVDRALVASRDPLEHAALSYVAARLDGFGEWKKQRPDPVSLAVPLP